MRASCWTTITASLCAALAVLVLPTPARADAVATIKARGKLVCSVALGGFDGFTEPDGNGWKGLDVDICKAIATAILGPGDNVAFHPVSWGQRFEALRNGTVDILTSTTQTLARDTETNLQFSLPYFHAPVRFLARAGLRARSARELASPKVCITTGTNPGRVASAYLRGLGVAHEIVALETTDQVKQAYAAGRCDVFGGYGPALAALRARDADPNAHVILADQLSNEPTGLAFKPEEKSLLNIANYVLSALLEAEELELSSANIDNVKGRSNLGPRQRILLGLDPFVGAKLGLRETWAYDVVKGVGNYEELYHRSLGKDSPYKLERGLNQLWLKGGMLFPLPFS